MHRGLSYPQRHDRRADQGSDLDRRRSDRPHARQGCRQRPGARRRHWRVRQGRAIGACRRWAADVADRRPDGRGNGRVSADWRSNILKFWFGLGYDDWWKADPALDHMIRQRFLKLWAEKRQLPVESFVGDPLTAVAAVILFDQFPRNMFRGHADQFATDHLALAIARGSVDNGFDKDLTKDERRFLYMPFAHSESLADQDRALLLFTEIADAE